MAKPEGETGTTCPYCSIGCRLMVQVKQGRVIDVLPDYASPVDNGLLCVKGRFGVPEVVNSALRLTEPRQLTPSGYEVVSWERAMDAAREKLSATAPDGFLMLLSPQLSNEDLFARPAVHPPGDGRENMASAPDGGAGEQPCPHSWSSHAAPTAFDSIDRAEVILTLGFDSRYGYSPIGVRVKKAVEKGARLVTIGDMDTNLDMVADAMFKIEPSLWAAFLRVLLLPWGRAEEGRGIEGRRAPVRPLRAVRGCPCEDRGRPSRGASST